MYYITVKQSPRYHQMTLEEFLNFEEPKYENGIVTNNFTNTKTYCVDSVSDKLASKFNSVEHLIRVLRDFNKTTDNLREFERSELYSTFYIPKKSGGLRRIDAPKYELMEALRTLKAIFENEFDAMYHTCAFAYVKNRSTIDAVKRHQRNNSKWFAKFDLSNFFGSTTLDFVMRRLSTIVPFSFVIKDAEGKAELEKALELGFLNGVLPQGTPISPTITNIMMIPIDYKINKCLTQKSFVYTRYADDFIISSKYSFNSNNIEKQLIDILKEYDAPFTINPKKTRYGSSAGSNWNLGVMLNKDNNITIGHKNKKRLQAMLCSYVLDRKNGKPWDKSDVQVLNGHINYYKMVEGEVIDKIIEHSGDKFGVNIYEILKEDLK